MKPFCSFPVFSLLLLASTAFSQQQELSINPLKFGGVRALLNPNGECMGYHTLYMASATFWGMEVFGTDLGPVYKTEVEVPRNAFFNEMAYDGESFLVSFVEASFKRELTYVSLNSKGQETNRLTRSKVPFLNQGKRFYPKLFVHPQGGFLIAEAVKQKDAGFSVEHVDGQLGVQWKKEVFANKGSMHVYDMRSSRDRVLVLMGAERFGNVLSTSLLALDAASGQQHYEHALTNGESTFFPTAFNLEPDGSTVLTGTYYKGGKIESKNARGLFFTRLDGNGGELANTYYDWKSLRPLLKTAVSDWFFSINPELWLHTVERGNDGAYHVVGELFKYLGEVTETGEDSSDADREPHHRVRLLDFMVFSFGQNGMLTASSRIEKPHMMAKIKKGGIMDNDSFSMLFDKGGALARNRAMKDFGLFAFRFTQPKTDGQNWLAFVSYENFTHYAYGTSLPGYARLAQYPMNKAKPRVFSQLELLDAISRQYGSYLELAGSTRFFDETENLLRGVLPAGNGMMMVYEYQVPGRKLHMQLVPLD